MGTGVMLAGKEAVMVGMIVGAGGSTFDWQPPIRKLPTRMRPGSVFNGKVKRTLRANNVNFGIGFDINNRSPLLDTIQTHHIYQTRSLPTLFVLSTF